jgi:hypothetical protein
VAVGDFNGDGIPDLATANTHSNSVSILLGNGDGTFQNAVDYDAGPGPASVAAGDFSHDGTLDLAVANAIPTNTVSVLLGQGDGSFQAPFSYATGTSPDFVAVGDFNGDNFPDLAVANGLIDNRVSVLINAADWEGGYPAASLQPHLPTPEAGAPSQPPLDLHSAALAAHGPPALRQLPQASTDQPTQLVSPLSMAIDRGQADATSYPRPLFTVMHAQDAVMGEWGDPMVEVLALSWMG